MVLSKIKTLLLANTLVQTSHIISFTTLFPYLNLTSEFPCLKRWLHLPGKMKLSRKLHIFFPELKDYVIRENAGELQPGIGGTLSPGMSRILSPGIISFALKCRTIPR